jgi:SAM-dependent methyltransferase
MTLVYSSQYYRRLNEGSIRSARAIVPLMIELVQPKRVVDVGCGTGAWLAEFQRRGVNDVLGIDGPHISADQLEIDSRNFLAADLTQPLRLSSQFDLALSLEVAEHLQPENAERFVDALTRLAPVVLFSAAIPFQGGQHHLNEQWPTYWAQLFDKRDFEALDSVRRLWWERTDIDWWYAQNLVLYVRRDHALRRLQICTVTERGVSIFVHPDNYLNKVWQNRVLRLAVDLATATASGSTIVLADQDQFGQIYLPGRTLRPIVERGGEYYGPPNDGPQAISELLRMSAEGAEYFAIGWPAFWWLTHYEELAAWLQQHHELLLQNDNLVLYQLRR